jgi:predicted anti-sigma-YlaC factor YlaD
MTNTSNAHLSNDQFMECALSTPDTAAEAHLASCERCRSELTTFQQSLNDFGRTSAAWSESMPKVSLRPMVKAKHQRTIAIQTAWALAAVILLAVAMPAWNHHRLSTAPSETAAADDSAAQIAQDNQMMQSVYVALAPNDPSPFLEYRVNDPRSPRTKSSAAMRTQ